MNIRLYEKTDKKAVISCLEGLCDYLIPLDPLKRIRRLPGWGSRYMESLLKILDRNDGVMFVAEDKRKVIGIIAGKILKISNVEKLSFHSKKSGRVVELFVHPSYRRTGVGKKLIETIEEYFKKLGCDLVRIEVFEPNRNAHSFYSALGYTDRVLDLIKEL